MLTMTRFELLEGWKEQEPETNPAVMDAYMRLAGAIVERAIRDAATSTLAGHRARVWLLSDDAGLYLECLSIDRGTLEGWIQAGAPLPKRNDQRAG